MWHVEPDAPYFRAALVDHSDVGRCLEDVDRLGERVDDPAGNAGRVTAFAGAERDFSSEHPVVGLFSCSTAQGLRIGFVRSATR
jgi:hypothetical protein